MHPEAGLADVKKSKVPRFEVGDTVDVHVLIREGEKERVQVFSGTVISKRGGGTNAMYTVRRIVQSQGVERTFPLHSPFVKEVRVRRSGRVRRAKLYYLRDRRGKSARLKEIVDTKRKPKGGRKGAPNPKIAPETAPPATEPVEVESAES